MPIYFLKCVSLFNGKTFKILFLAQNKSVQMTMLTKALLKKKKTQIVFTCSLRGKGESLHIKLYSLSHLHYLGGYRWLRDRSPTTDHSREVGYPMKTHT